MTMVDLWTLFAAQNPHGQAKVFLRKFYAIWALAFQEVPLPFPGEEGRGNRGIEVDFHSYSTSV